ncbi:MAG: hypothetical protein GY859_17395, partial [Desulfobacterales bacterium]|nr:hypothetical protein [Desulfobacterales bacterium]
MQKKESQGFNIRFDDDDDEKLSALSQQFEKDQIDQLRKRVSRLVALLLLLICALTAGAVFFHLDVRKRVVGKDADEGRQVVQLSERLESGLSSLSVRQAKVESSLAKNRSALEKSAKSIKETITPLEKDLAALKKKQPELKAGLDALEKDLDSMQSRMAVIQKGLAPLKKEMDALGSRVAQTEKTIYKSIQETLKDFADDLTAAGTADREELSKALAELQTEFRKEFQKELPPLQKRLDDAFAQLQGLDNGLTQEVKILSADLENAGRDINRLESKITSTSRETNTKLSRMQGEISGTTSTAVTHVRRDGNVPSMLVTSVRYLAPVMGISVAMASAVQRTSATGRPMETVASTRRLMIAAARLRAGDARGAILSKAAWHRVPP